MEKHFNVFVVLYNNFTALDAIGAMEILGCVSNSVRYVSLKGGTIENRQGIRILTETFDKIEKKVHFTDSRRNRKLDSDKG